MKNVILIAVYMTLAALTFGIVMALHGREARGMELSDHLSSAVEETVENCMLEKNYEVKGDDLFLTDFMESFAAGLDTKSDLTLKVLRADADSGLLSVEAEENYEHLNGRRGTVGGVKTVIFNRLFQEPLKSHQVCFYLSADDMTGGQNCYKTYCVAEGDLITAPLEPLCDGAQFNGWRDINGYLADFTEAVTEERIYYADWRRD